MSRAQEKTIPNGHPVSPHTAPSLQSETENKRVDEAPFEEASLPMTDLKRTSSNILNRVASRLSTTSTLEPPPDGGRAWIQCFMAWLVVFNTWGYVNSYGSFQAYYVETLDMSPSTISWIGSAQCWILFFISAFSGRALDAGYFLPTFVAGAVIQVIGIFMTSLSTKYWQLFLAQGVCTGIGGGIFFCPSMALVATYFSTHRGIAVALATTGNSAGGMIYPLIVTHLLPKIGFGWTIRVLGFINLACLAVVLAFMRPRLPPRNTGPLLEWSAFKEPPFVLFVSGLFCFMWALYFSFYYVSIPTVCLNDMTILTPADCHLWPASNGSLIPRFGQSPRHSQRHRHTRSHCIRLHRGPIPRRSQHVCPTRSAQLRTRILLARRLQQGLPLRFRMLLRFGICCTPKPATYHSRQPDERLAQDGHETRDGV